MAITTGYLEQMLQDDEGEFLECKRQYQNVEDRVQETICAFANDLAGHNRVAAIVLGLENDRACAGLPIDDGLLKRLADIASNGNIRPMASINIQKLTIRQCSVAVISVAPSSDTPVRYKGVVYVRVGPTTRRASPEDERILIEKRRGKAVSADLEPLLGSSSADLDISYFQETYLPNAIDQTVLNQNQRPVNQQLASLRFISAEQDTTTVVGMLTIGKDPIRFIPGAYVQFLRIQGTELSDAIMDEKRLTYPIGDLLKSIDDLLQINISSRVEILGSKEERIYSYPIDALRQMVRNAVMHRSYEGTATPVRVYWFSDRVEIHSPGGPYGQVTPETLGQPGLTDYRNPHIAEVMRTLGYVQKFGAGFEIARSQLKKNGNPELTVTANQNHVLITVYGR